MLGELVLRFYMIPVSRREIKAQGEGPEKRGQGGRVKISEYVHILRAGIFALLAGKESSSMLETGQERSQEG